MCSGDFFFFSVLLTNDHFMRFLFFSFFFPASQYILQRAYSSAGYWLMVLLCVPFNFAINQQEVETTNLKRIDLFIWFTGATGRFSHFTVVLGRAGGVREKEYCCKYSDWKGLTCPPIPKQLDIRSQQRSLSRPWWKQVVFHKNCPQLQGSEFSGTLDVWKCIATAQRSCVPFFQRDHDAPQRTAGTFLGH